MTEERFMVTEAAARSKRAGGLLVPFVLEPECCDSGGGTLFGVANFHQANIRRSTAGTLDISQRFGRCAYHISSYNSACAFHLEASLGGINEGSLAGKTLHKPSDQYLGRLHEICTFELNCGTPVVACAACIARVLSIPYRAGAL
jgi:hypothetical protein